MNRRTFLHTAAIAATAVVPVTAGCSGGTGEPTVFVTELGYNPRQLSIDVGETVTWVNKHKGLGSRHTVTAKPIHEDAAPWEFDETLENEGDEVSHTFEERGIYTYVGTIRGEDCMCGAVVVGDASLDDPLPCSPVRGGGC